MTPEDNFKELKELKKQLEQMIADIQARQDDSESRLKRIERSCEFLANNQAQLSAGLAELVISAKQTSHDVRQVSADVAKLVTVASGIIQALEDHTKNGHGGVSGS